MNRRYSTQLFKQIVERIRNTYNDSVLTTDIIVGFPGETQAEFDTTYEFLKQIKFYKMHIFKYSVRKGTAAEKMPNHVSPEIKEERSNKLLELSDKFEEEYLKEYIRKNVKVLFEEKDKEGFFKGHTQNYLVVKVKTDDDLNNKLLDVKIIGFENSTLIGELI
jgi:threonylcarbamoyladenosine tRNA methylthiotransferase MtaB